MKASRDDSWWASSISRGSLVLLTFELDDLSILCLGQPFETHLTGQRQTHTTAAQQEANLLAPCILWKEA